jgi:hypothetical protein
MQAYELRTWERVKELAAACKVTIELHSTIAFFDKDKLNLGHFSTVAEAYAFLCGYEHACDHAEESLPSRQKWWKTLLKYRAHKVPSDKQRCRQVLSDK